MQDLILGIDLGGTHLRAAIVNTSDGIIHNIKKIPTLAHLGHQEVLNRIVGIINQVLSETETNISNIQAIGIGVPGTVDLKSGTIQFLPNLPGQWKGVNITQFLGENFGLPVFVINDVRAMTLGEWKFGAGARENNIACFAIGTGIGGGIVVNNFLHLGIGGTAGEFGHIVVERGGIPCGCGGNGCLEMYASGPAIVSMAKKFVMHGHTTLISEMAMNSIENITAETVISAAKEADPRAIYILKEAGYYLGVAVNNILVTFSPRKIVFGGGVSEAGDLIFSHTRNYLQEQVHMVPFDQVEICIARLGTDAGLIGAALWAKQNF